MKRAVPVFLFAVLFVVFGFQVRSAEAWSTYSTNGSTGNCASCHGDFNAGGSYTSLADGQSWVANLHDVHRNTMLSGDCDTCHGSGGRSPVVLDSSVGGDGLDPISCVGCHGRAQDGGNDSASGGLGAGLRQHHTDAGVNTCTGCHTDANPANYATVGENVLPPYYENPGNGHPNMPTNPCNQNGNENFAGGSEGLDNDGNGIYDDADPACQAGDTTPPTVASTVPVSNAMNVAFNTLVTATFSEAIDNTTVDGTSFFVTDGGGNVGGTLSVSQDNTMVTFTSSADLAASTVYTATVTTAVTDLAGNPLAADYTWSFTTGSGPDTTPPTVISTVPDNNAISVAVSTTISATFSEAIDGTTVDASTFFVTDGVDNVVGTFNVAGSTATFTPSSALADNTAYAAMVTTGVTDLAGNPLAADYTWVFTTAAASSGGGGGGGGGCSVTGRSGGGYGGAAVLFLTLLAILVALRQRGARARR